MINVFTTTSSPLVPEEDWEEYILFFDKSVDNETLSQELKLNLYNFIEDHIYDYMHPYLKDTTYSVDDIKRLSIEFMESVTVCSSIVTDDMLMNIVDSADISDDSKSEVIEFASDDDNLYHLDDFDFITDFEEEDEEEVE